MSGFQENDSENTIVNIALRKYLDTTSDMVFVKDSNLKYLAASLPFLEITKKKHLSEIIGYTDFDIFTLKLAEKYREDDRNVLDTGKDIIDMIERISPENELPRYSSTSKYLIRDSAGKVLGLLGISKDISLQILAKKHYQWGIHDLINLPHDYYTVLLIDVESWTIVEERQNEINAYTISPYANLNNFIARALSGVEQNSEAYKFFTNFSKDFLISAYNEGKRNFSMEYCRKFMEGLAVWVRDEIKLILNPKTMTINCLFLVKNIDEEKRAEEQIIYAMEKDAMTDVYNRATGKKLIGSYLLNEARNCNCALMIADLDNLKIINDKYGHQAGDEALNSLVKVIKAIFRSDDIVYRYGGDEFVVLMKNITSLSAVSTKMKSLFQLMRTTKFSFSNELILTASVGITLCRNGETALHELFKQADEALYQAKTQGRNQFVFYHEMKNEDNG